MKNPPAAGAAAPVRNSTNPAIVSNFYKKTAPSGWKERFLFTFWDTYLLSTSAMCSMSISSLLE